MQVHNLPKYVPPPIQASTDNEVRENFKGVFYIHTVGSLEQTVVTINTDTIVRLLPNATVKNVTYDGCDYDNAVLKLKELFIEASQEDAIHLLITASLQTEEERLINSNTIYSIGQQYGLKFYLSNIALFRNHVSMGFEFAKAILKL